MSSITLPICGNRSQISTLVLPELELVLRSEAVQRLALKLRELFAPS
jgi:hypothetical protein